MSEKEKGKETTLNSADINEEAKPDGGSATQTSPVDQKNNEKMETAQESQIDPLTDLKQQLDMMSDRNLRLMAEFDNFKKRASRDYERLVDSANEKMTIDLIDVRENFDRALRSAEAGNDYKVLLDGIKLIYTKFDSVLSKHGLEVFAEPGDEFDPQIHDALMKTA
ncbi:MAG TPA: nucleotide exchange factor GrpE, partial [Chitinispirillaceae bacterium]|nr:nucleotide exchange factor GrpE [Chitinispirillaceae bacterium]